MASIYDLTEAFCKLWDLMDDGILEDGVLEEVFENTTEELAIKLEGYCKFIKNCESDIAGLKAEEKRLKARREVLENTIERSKKAMQVAMEVAGEKKLKCGMFNCSIQKNPQKVIIDVGLSEIPDKYLVPQEPKVDKKLMLDELKADSALPDLEGIAHLEQDESLRIR